MMQTAGLVGRRVIGRSDGADLGTVRDVVCDTEAWQLYAMLVQVETAVPRAVTWDQVMLVGRDVVLVETDSAAIPLGDDPRLRQLVQSGTSLCATRIYDTAGQPVGTLGATYCDQISGQIVAYESAGAMVQGQMQELRLLPPERATPVEPAPPHSSETATGRDDLRVALPQRAGAGVIGQPAALEVTAPDGTVLLTPGLIVTETIMEQARLAGREAEVIASARLGAASKSTEAVRETAVGLWKSLKQKAAELTGNELLETRPADDEPDPETVKDALGRPVSRPIMDHYDRIILNPGEPVTEMAVARARNAGVLDVLLRAVDRAPVAPDLSDLANWKPG